MRLPGVEEIPDEVGDGDAGENPAVDELRRHPDNVEAKRGDQEELDDVVEGDGAEAVGVAAGEELHFFGGRVDRAGRRASSRTRETVNNAAWREAKGDSVR